MDSVPVKVCRECGTERPATTEFFHRDGKNRDGLTNACATCRASRQAARRAADPEKVLEIRQRFNANNPDASATYNRKHRAVHGDAVRTLNSVRNLEWKEKNPQAHRAIKDRAQQKRRERERAAPGVFTKLDLQIIAERQGGKCFYCGIAPDGDLTVDHFIPIDKGGTHYVENLVMACMFCNCSKGPKLPWEWMPERFNPPSP